MSMSHSPASQAFHPSAPLAHLAGWMARRWQFWMADLTQGLRQREPRSPEELLEWAGRYDKTQPSYAADLRAAALRAQEEARAH